MLTYNEEGMATQFSIHARRIPWTEESGRGSPQGHRVRHNWSNLACMHIMSSYKMKKNTIKNSTSNSMLKMTKTKLLCSLTAFHIYRKKWCYSVWFVLKFVDMFISCFKWNQKTFIVITSRSKMFMMVFSKIWKLSLFLIWSVAGSLS